MLSADLAQDRYLNPKQIRNSKYKFSKRERLRYPAKYGRLYDFIDNQVLREYSIGN